jgi:phage gpG-like protein
MANDFEWTISNLEDFKTRLDRLGKATDDFRIPFRLISSDFYRSQKQLFQLKSAGLFQDLSENYKPVKQKTVGFIYPILVGKTRDLSESTLSNSHRNSIYFLGRQELQIGTNVAYGKYHQSDEPRSTIPQRKFIFIDGGKGDKSRGSGINGRRERWLDIIDTHIKQLLTGSIE